MVNSSWGYGACTNDPSLMTDIDGNTNANHSNDIAIIDTSTNNVIDYINVGGGSDITINKVQEILKNVVIRGTGSRLYAEDFSMAGKTGTARTEYWEADWATNRRYISSFTGYFPAENPKYSCIVVIHKPDAKTGFYGADVSGPVFKDIAQKIYTSNHSINQIENITPLLSSFIKEKIQYEAEGLNLVRKSTEKLPL